MTAEKKIHVALVGLRFGAEFIPIYLHHPNVASLTICDIDGDVLANWGDKYQVERRSDALEKIVGTNDIDAVTAANWTVAGICAHESAIRDGELVTVPSFHEC